MKHQKQQHLKQWMVKNKWIKNYNEFLLLAPKNHSINISSKSTKSCYSKSYKSSSQVVVSHGPLVADNCPSDWQDRCALSWRTGYGCSRLIFGYLHKMSRVSGPILFTVSFSRNCFRCIICHRYFLIFIVGKCVVNWWVINMKIPFLRKVARTSSISSLL